MTANLYVPKQAVISEIVEENSTVNTYQLTLIDDSAAQPLATMKAGQFVMLSVPHCGEAPLSLSALPSAQCSKFSLTVRKSGQLTDALHQLSCGDTVGIRGPYGQPFELDEMGVSPLFIAGGIGLAPLRPVIEYCTNHRDKFARVSLLYGCKSSTEFCFKHDFERWQCAGMGCHLTVDQQEQGWLGEVGLVTEQLTANNIAQHDQFYICGPGVMIRFVIERLEHFGVKREQIVTTLERHMKCGVGICGHCHLEEKLVCIDGPVFRGTDLPKLTEL